MASAVRTISRSPLGRLASSPSTDLLLTVALVLPIQDLYAVEGFRYQEKISLSKLKLLASNFSTVFAVLQGLPGSLPWGVLLTFLNDFLSQHKNMSIAQATWVSCRCRAVSCHFCVLDCGDFSLITEGLYNICRARVVCHTGWLGPVIILQV